MTKKQIAALRGVLDRATRRAKESQNEGEGLWLHHFVIEPLTIILRTVHGGDKHRLDDLATAFVCERSKLPK